VIVEGERATVILAGDASFTQQSMLAGIVDGRPEDEQAARETLARLRRFA
jgi:hypothetical protein